MSKTMHTDDTEREELAAQVRFERLNRWRFALDPRDPEYIDPEDFNQPTEDNEE